MRNLHNGALLIIENPRRILLSWAIYAALTV